MSNGQDRCRRQEDVSIPGTGRKGYNQKKTKKLLI